MSQIKTFVTNLGQTIIGVIKNEAPDFYELENAVAIGVQPQANGQASLQFGPIIPLANDTGKGINIKVYKANLLEFQVKAEVQNHYEQLIGKITLVPAGALVGLDKITKLSK